jgi:hypothetical protein
MVNVYLNDSTVFNAGDLMGKTLIARKRLTAYNSSLTEPIGYIAAGQPAGVVYSYLEPKPGVRDKLFWVFEVNGFFYYIPHERGAFDVSVIKQQGVLTLEEKLQKELERQDQESRGWLSQLLGLPSASTVGAATSKILWSVGILAAVAYVGGIYVKKKM